MYTISSIWIDVMRIAQLPEECGQHDENWWAKHQKEIEFVLKVLDGLGLVERPDSTVKERDDECYYQDDEKDEDEDEDEDDDKQKRKLKNDEVLLGDHKVILRPTKAMMRLYRAAQDHYLHARDGNVRARLARLIERKATRK